MILRIFLTNPFVFEVLFRNVFFSWFLNKIDILKTFIDAKYSEIFQNGLKINLTSIVQKLSLFYWSVANYVKRSTRPGLTGNMAEIQISQSIVLFVPQARELYSKRTAYSF